MKHDLVLIGILCLLIAGCGTVNTVMREDAVARDNLKEMKSHCGTIPRVYSGVSYDFCKLRGHPDPGFRSVEVVIFDFVFSGLFDTLALPYTIYRQSVDGSIYIQQSDD